MNQDKISTGLGNFSKEKFNALLTIREAALDSITSNLKGLYRQVTTSSLVNIAGSCENPHASFTLNYYGREAHLSQSAQLQLEALVMRLKKGFFTINNSFREENYDDPEAKGRRLSEFTLIEAERPYGEMYGHTFTPEEALNHIVGQLTKIMRFATEQTAYGHAEEVKLLGGDLNYFNFDIFSEKRRLTYDETLTLLNKEGCNLEFGDDLGIKEERKILQSFSNLPVFVTHHPASIKFFNMKRTPDNEHVYSVDLLMPRLGETVGGAIREESGEQIKKQLLESRLGKYLQEKDQDPLAPFQEYWNIFKQEPPLLRGGYGIGFERFIAFLLNSNDILETIAYKTLQPK